MSREKINKNLINGVTPYGVAPSIEAVGLPWVGGKKSKCSEYIRHFPDDKSVLVDLFTGGGSIGFTSSQKFKEVVMNDIDYNIISLYKYLAGDEDLRKILDYEYSEQHFKYAHNLIRNKLECIELKDRAKYTIADIFQSFNSGRNSYKKREYNKNYYDKVYKCISKIRYAIHQGNIQFEVRSAFEVLKDRLDDTDVFWFVDPPYENKLINSHVYYKSMLKDWEQKWLAYLLSISKGKFMLCGYRGEDGSIYGEWLCDSRFYCYKLLDTYAYCGSDVKGEEKDKRTEYIWTNYMIGDLEEIDMSKAA